VDFTGVTILGFALVIIGCTVRIVAALDRITDALKKLQVNASATSVGCPSCSSWHNIDYTDKENSDGS